MHEKDRLEALATGAQFDVCSYSAARSASRFIHHAAVPGRGTVPLFKVLLTNVCVNDCAYCANQAGRDAPRASFKPEELARLFMQVQSKGLARGLFLTSGVAGSALRTQQAMIDTVEILRHKHGFKGYVHLKILPGAPFDCVEAACALANRVSLNMEAPTAHHLARLSSKKDLHGDIVERMRWVRRLRAADSRIVPAGQTTQFVVGAAGETDRDILRTAAALYDEIDLRRVYFSAFRPVTRSRLEGLRPAPPEREHRLYQADWLLRVYGFSPHEIELAFGAAGNLSLARDPKLVIAQRQPWLFPVDVNSASYSDLLRVPGIGPMSAKRILQARREHRVSSLEELKKLRVAVSRAARFIWFKGIPPSETQTSFLPQIEEELGGAARSLAECLG